MEQVERGVGTTLGGTYRLERLLGSGGMGEVFAGCHLRTGGLVAVKLLRPESARIPAILRRFKDEALVVGSLRHQHIAQVIDFATEPSGTPYIVMELLKGEDLDQRLNRQERLPWNAAVQIALQAGSALQSAHDLGSSTAISSRRTYLLLSNTWLTI